MSGSFTYVSHFLGSVIDYFLLSESLVHKCQEKFDL